MYGDVDIEVERVIDKEDYTTYIYLPIRSTIKTVAKVFIPKGEEGATSANIDEYVRAFSFVWGSVAKSFKVYLKLESQNVVFECFCVLDFDQDF